MAAARESAGRVRPVYRPSPNDRPGSLHQSVSDKPERGKAQGSMIRGHERLAAGGWYGRVESPEIEPGTS
jgi:hypothetical protein